MIEIGFPIWFIFLCGLVVGSFLNVVIYRLPLKRSLIRPGSRCQSCNAPVRWFDNIPVLSWFLLKGRCRSCKARIPFRYVCVELMTGLMFVATYVRFGPSWLLLVHDWPFVSLLIAITFIDLDHRIIPDELSLGGLVLGLLTSGLVQDLGFVPAAIGSAVGFGIFYGFAWLYLRYSGRSGLGGGDIKLLAMLGSFLGTTGVFTTILISSITGSVIGIVWGLAQRQKKVMATAIPYGPFLVLGALYAYLLGDILWSPFTIPT